jgi:hypothetical protein
MELTAGQLVIGSVYRFTFSEPFVALGHDLDPEATNAVGAGYYRVEELLTHEQILERGIDLVEFLFGLVDLTEADYQVARAGTEEVPGYLHQDFVQLVHVTSKQVVYMPSTNIATIPIANVQEYNKLAMAVDIGIIGNSDADIAALNGIRQLIRDLMMYEHGIDLGVDEDDNPLPELMLYDTQWLTEGEYADILIDRATRKYVAIEGHPFALSDMAQPTNLFAEIAKLKTERDALLTRINVLEEHLITLAEPSPL